MAGHAHVRRLDPDWVLSAIALGLALTSALLLTRPEVPHPVGWQPPTPPAGRLDFEVGEVRRRPAGSLVWYSAEPGDTVFLGDALFVSEGGLATVALEDGASLEVEEKTLLVLEPSGADSPASIALQRGAVVVSSGQAGRALLTPGGAAALAAESEAVLTRSGAELAVQVREGSLALRDGALGKDGRARVDAKEVARLQPFAVRLTAPAPNHQQLAGRRVTFRWGGGAERATVQVATDRGFGQLGDPTAPFAAGTWWWRVVGGDGAPLSETRRFTILEDRAPAALAPVEDARISSTEVPLHWQPVEGASRYRVELSATADFKVTAFADEVRAARAVWSGARDGLWYWRVRARLAAEPGQWSAPERFRVVLRPLPAAPILSAPELEVSSETPPSP